MGGNSMHHLAYYDTRTERYCVTWEVVRMHGQIRLQLVKQDYDLAWALTLQSGSQSAQLQTISQWTTKQRLVPCDDAWELVCYSKELIPTAIPE